MNFIKSGLVILALILGINYTYGSHASGGNISFIATAIPNQFQITLTLYSDCGGIPAPTDVDIELWNDCGLTLPTISLTSPTVTEVSQLCPSALAQSECNGGNLPGVESNVWTGYVFLDPTCDSWHASYALNARNPSDNLNGGTMYLETTINTAVAPNNTTPVVGAAPIPYVCVNLPVAYDMAVVEPDGDSLFFELTDPLQGAGNPNGFVAGYSATAPIPGITINPSTGQLDFIPTATGTYVVAVMIEEYNSVGVLISTTIHDMQFEVINCVNTPPEAPLTVDNFNDNGTGASLNLDPLTNTYSISACDGDFFSFDVTFSDIDIPDDTVSIVSNIQTILPGSNISFTGTNPTTATVDWTVNLNYTGTIISFNANDGACPIMGIASFSVALDIPPPLGVSPNDSICGNQVAEIFAEGDGPILWTSISGDPIVIGTNFTCNGCFDPVATPSVTTTYVAMDSSGCQLTDTVTIQVEQNFGGIIANIATPDTAVCPGECVPIDGYAQEDFTGTTTQTFSNTTDGLFGPNSTYAPSPNPPLPTSIFVAGVAVGFDTLTTNSIKEVCINIEHDDIGDLVVNLMAPDGQIFELTSNNGATNDDYNICFTPNALFDVTVPNVPLNSGSNYLPEGGPIGSAFTNPGGLDTVLVQGFWNIQVINQGTGFGVLHEWSITFCDPFDFPVAAAFLSWDNQDGMPPGPAVADPVICPTQTGWYTLTAFDVDMCWESDSIEITILPLPDPGISSTPQICVEAGVIDLFTYLGGTPDAGGYWEDSTGTVVNPVMNANVLWDNAPYYYIAQTPSGCRDTATVTPDVITVTATTVAVDSDCQACNGSVQINPSGGVTPYTFTDLTSATAPQVSNSFTNLCGSGNYDFLIEDAIGCVFNISDVVNDINLPIITDTFIVDASCFSFCDGEIAVIGQNLQSYSIDGAPPVNNNTFSGLCAGTYDITAYSGQNGLYCSVDLLNVVITEPDELIITDYPGDDNDNSTTDNVLVCQENELTLFVDGQGGDGNYTYTWYQDNYTNSIGTGPLLTTPYNNGDFYVIMSEGSCPQDTAHFTAYQPQPVFPALTTTGGRVDGCAPLLVEFNPAPTQNKVDIETIKWSFSNGHYLVGDHDDLLEYEFTNPGIYDVTMTVTTNYSPTPTNDDDEQCIFDTTYYSYIEAYGTPKLNFTSNPIQATIYEPNATMVNLSSNTAVSFEWDFGSDATPQTSTERNPTITFEDAVPGRYPISLKGWNVHGCENIVFGEVQIINDVQTYAPNVFTPDGNNFNEKWRVYISGIDIYDYELTIYNRYGEIVWKSYDSEAEWDGTYGNNGNVVQDGTYPWVIVAKDALDDKKYQFKGTVNIVK